ncbi:MAG: DUF922 domain-containing protein [Nonlabens sp.]|uniref:DUF922 domain-containing protein n=1 Tax=Nonlabens sp. TaxID=1888209 RepID=UPI003219A730
MKLFTAVFFIYLCIGNSLTNLHSDPVERFTYQEHSKLNWSDFKGVPPKNAIYFASVNSSLGYTFTSKTVDGKINVEIKVECYFYPQLSWKRNLNENNPDLLDHEQLHWDISELYARKLRAAFQKYVPQKDPKKEIDFIFRKFEKDRQQAQKSYDRETRHGVIKETQKSWESKIKEALFITSEFAVDP